MRVILAPSSTRGIGLYDLNVDTTGQYRVSDLEGTFGRAVIGTKSWLVHVADGVNAHDPIALAIPMDEFIRRRISAADRFIAALNQKPGDSSKGTPGPGRTDRFHCFVLRAIDGAAAGASHREIAVAIHGQRRVSRAWTPDGDLRASIRYFLKRGTHLVKGGYRTLIYR